MRGKHRTSEACLRSVLRCGDCRKKVRQLHRACFPAGAHHRCQCNLVHVSRSGQPCTPHQTPQTPCFTSLFHNTGNCLFVWSQEMHVRKDFVPSYEPQRTHSSCLTFWCCSSLDSQEGRRWHIVENSAAIVEVAGWGHAFVGQEAELFQEVTILQRGGQRSIPFPAESRAWHNIRSALLLLWHHKSCLSYSFKCSC